MEQQPSLNPVKNKQIHLGRALYRHTMIQFTYHLTKNHSHSTKRTIFQATCHHRESS